MARGHQKIQAQQKNAEKKAKMKKGSSQDAKKSAAAALKFSCTVCKVSCPSAGDSDLFAILIVCVFL